MKIAGVYHKGCMICGSALNYFADSQLMKCEICHQEFASNAQCANGHFICDKCHQINGVDYIEHYCIDHHISNPTLLLNEILTSDSIKMHGPEHHFLVPAVLITAYFTKLGKEELIKDKLKIAKQRSHQVLGGFCGFYGTCGAGIGNGIFLSIALDSTPLKKEEWKLSNLLTAKTLEKIALSGGPRCCKRDSFIAIEMAISFIQEYLSIELESSKIHCGFSSINKECKLSDCQFFGTI